MAWQDVTQDVIEYRERRRAALYNFWAALALAGFVGYLTALALACN